MKVICWNIQGAKKSQLRHEVGFINRTIKPDILILLETLVNCQNTDLIINQLGYRFSSTIPPVNHTGGIWLLWNDDNVDVSVVAKETRIIHCLVHDKLTAKECLLSAVYAPARENHKDAFWDHLQHLNDSIDQPWVLMGDFNEMLCASEKIGGIPLTPNKVQRLNNFLQYSNSSDAIVQGRLFTWKKFIRGQLMYEKLDRVVFRNDCLHLFPNYMVTNGPFTCSDHAYVLLNTDPHHAPRRGTTFKYQHSWVHYQDTHSIIKRNWSTRISGTAMYRVAQKLKKTKLDLKTWSKRTFGNFRSKFERNGDKLLEVEDKLTRQPNNARLNNWHFRLLKQREKMHLFHQKYWGKLNRKEWLVNGDRHSRYFHQAMKARKSRQRIMKLKDAAGVWIEETTRIQQLFIHDFTLRFKSAHTSATCTNIELPKMVTEDDNLLLLQPVQDHEIKDAVFQMDKFKAPGPDGFGGAFFQNHWNIIAPDVCRAIKSFFTDGKLLKQVNHTLIALIPKVENPSSTAQFRPISLCNSFYKIIAKILVNRMRPLLDKIIDPVQSAFVPKRSIHDNILLTHEIMNKFKNMKGKKAWVALKLDMEKAYDRVEWGFLFEALKQIGFHSKWISWIKECVTTVSYSVIVNDEVCGFFKPTRGIRQGDPLSPYLFLICMEVLTRALRKAQMTKKASIGFKITPKADKIPCLLFADDSLLFCRTNLESCRLLGNLLNKFCQSSGQLINFHKSSLTFSKNATMHDRQIASSVFNITHQDSLGKYLGCPVFQGRPKSETFLDLVNKTASKLQPWKTKHISKAGRVALIQANIESMPAHTMQCFQLPRATTKQIDKISRAFFWKNSRDSSGLPMVAWDKICRPKKSGGLGLRKLEAVNSAFLSKLTWKLFHEQSLWVDQMRAKYPINEQFFATGCAKNDSWAWKCILRNRLQFRKGIRWKVGDGTCIRFWTDNWCANDSLLSLLAIDDTSHLDLSLLVSHFITSTKEWDVFKLKQFVDNATLQLILATPLAINSVPDSICWGLSGNGEFSTKTATWAAHGIDLKNSPSWEFKWIWNLDIMPKLKVFLWQLCHSSLPTREILLRRGLQIDPICPLCNQHNEDLAHLFFRCPTVHNVWCLATAHNWIPSTTSIAPSDTVSTWLTKLRQSSTLTRFDRIVALLWSIWKTRNSVVFRNEVPHAVVTLIRAKKASAEWRIRHKLSASLQLPHPPSSPPTIQQMVGISWAKPSAGVIKVNFDGSKNSHSAAGGYVLRDWSGHLLLAGAFNLGATSILVAEATAMRNGLRTAIEAGFNNIHIEGDNKTLIQAVQQHIQPPWEIQVLVQDILYFLQKCNHVTVNHIFREGNRAADWLAKLGLSLSSTSLWSQPCHIDLQRILSEDNLGYTLARRVA